MIQLTQFPRPVLATSLMVIAIVGWLATGSQPGQQNKSSEKSHIANYFVRDMDTVSMGFDGKPERQVETVRMTEFYDDETTEMETPFFTFYRSDTPPWKLHSEQGWLSADGELALLSGRVTMTRAATADSPAIKMVTSDVRIQPGNNYMETDNHVTITSANDSVNADGMQAWLDDPGRIKFLSNVRASYEPR